jgi:sarcosine oxidase
MHDVAVIGLGVMGSAAFRALARRGRRVIGLEQFQPGHGQGSSHGESRIIRLAYFEHPSYVHLVRAAFGLWRELERETGEELLVPAGILEAGLPGAQLVADSLASSVEHGLEHQVLSGREASARFPAFDLPADWTAVFQPDAGILRPDRALPAFLRAADGERAVVRFGARALSIEPAGSGVRIVLEGGEVIEAAAAVVAAGRWIGGLAPLMAPLIAPTRQVLAWFRPSRPELARVGAMPVFILDDGSDAVYGMPDFRGSGVKAGSHYSGGALARADAVLEPPQPDEVRGAARIVERYIPGAFGEITALQACVYTRLARSEDDDFVIDRHPEAPQIVLASPCSGHGFKFAPVIGEILADLALDGSTPHDISRFRLDRLAR